MHKIENMPLQTSSFFFRPCQMSQSACFSSKFLCSDILIGDRVRVKSSGLAKARTPGSAKFANALPPDRQGTRQANAPQ